MLENSKIKRLLERFMHPSSHNRGSVKNGCISNSIVTFQNSHFPLPRLWEKELNHQWGHLGKKVNPANGKT